MQLSDYDPVDRQRVEPDKTTRYMKVRYLDHSEYRKVRDALAELGMKDVMTVEPECFPSSGIWYVRRHRGGRTSTLITRKLRDLPKALKLAALWPFKELLTRWIFEFWEHARQDPALSKGYSANDMATYLIERLARQVQVESEEDFVQATKGVEGDETW